MAKSPSPGKATKPASASSVASSDSVAKRKADIEKLAGIPHLAFAKPYVLQYAVQMATVIVFFEEKVVPFIVMCVAKLIVVGQQLYPYTQGKNAKDLVPAVMGFGLCFFGGTFPLLIASVEAFRLVGWQGMKVALEDLMEEVNKAYEAHKKDEEEDKDGDGVPDAKQITGQELVARKGLLFLRVVNPEKVTGALACLNCGLLAVLATLKMSFARAITLGASLGVVLQKQVDARITPAITELVPAEYQKWIPAVIEYLTRAIAVGVAFMLQTIISAFHSAVRGGRMLGQNGVRYANRMGWIQFNEEDSLLDETVGYAAAALGFLFQLYMGFSLMLPFNLICIPITLIEYSLSVAVAWF